MARRVKPLRQTINDMVLITGCSAGDIVAINTPVLSVARTKEVMRKSLPAAVDKFRSIPKGKVLVLDRLREEHGFDPIAEMVKSYKDAEGIFTALKKDFEDKVITQNDIRLMQFMFTEKRQIVEEIQRYCYPHMKNADGHGQTKGSVTFNINTGSTNQTSGPKIVNQDVDEAIYEPITIDVSSG